MCEDCGCDQLDKDAHDHAHRHGLAHSHAHPHVHAPSATAEDGLTINLVSCPGAGKTALCEATAALLPTPADGVPVLAFIETTVAVGCTEIPDRGQTFNVALLPIEAGVDSPQACPALIAQSQVVLVTKIDRPESTKAAMDALRRNIRNIQPGVFIFELSARTGQGMDAWRSYLEGMIL
jgi:Ni2+-binding GTPase involved in maturation of urease and hydrogenase